MFFVENTKYIKDCFHSKTSKHNVTFIYEKYIMLDKEVDTMWKDRRGEINVGALLGLIVGTVVAVALIPVLQESINNANVTGAPATMLGLLPLLFVAVIVIAYVKLVS